MMSLALTFLIVGLVAGLLGLYGVAAEKGGRALTIATVSDHVRTGESTTSEEREQTFDEMVVIALETVRADVG